jgi:hypothetical protein
MAGTVPLIAEGEAKRDENRLAHAAAKLTPQISENIRHSFKGDRRRADGGAVTRPGSERRAGSEAWRCHLNAC